MTPLDIVSFIENRRFPLTMESELQAAIASELSKAGVAFQREVQLSPGDRVDFMIGAAALEIKTKGSRREMYRQCERYCAHERVEALVLASRTRIAMPSSTINGKPVFVASLSRAFL